MKEILFKFVDYQLSEQDRTMLRPKRQSEFASGFDLSSAHKEPVIIVPGGRSLISTGISLDISAGYEGQIRSRSGLSFKHAVIALNSPGTIDADYRGEIKVILANFGQDDFVVSFGMRIAQLVICNVVMLPMKETKYLAESERGANGFGSTGI